MRNNKAVSLVRRATAFALVAMLCACAEQAVETQSGSIVNPSGAGHPNSVAFAIFFEDGSIQGGTGFFAGPDSKALITSAHGIQVILDPEAGATQFMLFPQAEYSGPQNGVPIQISGSERGKRIALHPEYDLESQRGVDLGVVHMKRTPEEFGISGVLPIELAKQPHAGQLLADSAVKNGKLTAWDTDLDPTHRGAFDPFMQFRHCGIGQVARASHPMTIIEMFQSLSLAGTEPHKLDPLFTETPRFQNGDSGGAVYHPHESDSSKFVVAGLAKAIQYASVQHYYLWDAIATDQLESTPETKQMSIEAMANLTNTGTCFDWYLQDLDKREDSWGAHPGIDALQAWGEDHDTKIAVDWLRSVQILSLDQEARSPSGGSIATWLFNEIGGNKPGRFLDGAWTSYESIIADHLKDYPQMERVRHPQAPQASDPWKNSLTHSPDTVALLSQGLPKDEVWSYVYQIGADGKVEVRLGHNHSHAALLSAGEDRIVDLGIFIVEEGKITEIDSYAVDLAQRGSYFEGAINHQPDLFALFQKLDFPLNLPTTSEIIRRHSEAYSMAKYIVYPDADGIEGAASWEEIASNADGSTALLSEGLPKDGLWKYVYRFGVDGKVDVRLGLSNQYNHHVQLLSSTKDGIADMGTILIEDGIVTEVHSFAAHSELGPLFWGGNYNMQPNFVELLEKLSLYIVPTLG